MDGTLVLKKISDLLSQTFHLLEFVNQKLFRLWIRREAPGVGEGSRARS